MSTNNTDESVPYFSGMSRYGWRVYTESGTTYVDGVVDAPPSAPIGETAVYQCVVHEHKTIGRDPPDDHLAHWDRYEHLMGFAPHAGRFVVRTPASEATVRYREQHAEESLLVLLEPAYVDELPVDKSVWGLIESVADLSAQPEAAVFLDLELLVVAPGSRFESHTEVRQALESRGP